MYLEKQNPITNKPFEHENHTAATGRTPSSLTTQQKEFIIRWAQRHHEQLCSMLTTLPINYRKQLRENLALKRLHNTQERKRGESPAAYLYRRAHRDADSNALILMSNNVDEKEKKSKEGKKTKKTKKKKEATQKSFEEERETQLALDKDGGDVCNENLPALDATLNKATTNTRANFKPEFAQIDGSGGAIKAALQDDSNDATLQWNADTLT